MSTPVWLAATSGQPTLARQVNQLLGTHATQLIYTGASLGGQTTAGSGGTATNGLWLAQAFTPGTNQSPGRFLLTMSVTGSPGPFTVSIQTDASGHPSGTALATTVVPPGYVPGSSTQITIPLPCSLTVATQYWIVINAVGDPSDLYTWFKSNQASGASTSTNGSTWTAQAYGFLYSRNDQSAVTPLVHTYDDAGARWATLVTAAGTNLVSKFDDYVTGQSAGYVQAQRTLIYSIAALAFIT